EASRALGADFAQESPVFEFFFEELHETLGALGLAATARRARRTLVRADEDVVLKPRHGRPGLPRPPPPFGGGAKPEGRPREPGALPCLLEGRGRCRPAPRRRCRAQ